MLDIQFIREKKDLVQQKAQEKGYSIDIAEFIKIDNQRRELLNQIEELRTERNQIAGQAKSGQPDEKLIERGKLLKIALNEKETYFNQLDSQWSTILKNIPNLHSDDVPLGDESASQEISKFGPTDSGATDHLDLAESRGWLDFERGAKVAGSKFYYLKGDLVLLENALMQYGLDFLLKKGFTMLSVPHMVNSRTAEGTGFAPRTSDQSDEYFIQDEDLGLIATAEIPLTGFHADENLESKNLPLFYAAISPCYRKEAGTYGKHTRGLYRVHQFNKLEMYAYCLPEDSQSVHQQLLSYEEELWQSLNIPYRVINIAAGDLGAPAAKKYDIEYWSKVDQSYRELTSCSNCTDYQARNLNIKYRKVDGSFDFLHTLNGTAVASSRALIAVIEHWQATDNKINIPEVIRPYLQNRQQI